MASIGIKAALVGMRFYDISIEEALVALNSGVSLKREPQNPHDTNAIAVTSSGRMIGHIDRDSAQRVAPLLDRGANCRCRHDNSRSNSTRTIPISLTISQSVQVPSCPTICHSKTVGIYEIAVKREMRSYFGQSLDVQNRVKAHWEALANGLHSNPELQQHWQTYGPNGFEARLVESAATGLDDLALARWLVEKERYWIDACGGMRSVINAEYPRPVLSGHAEVLLEAERRKFSEELQRLNARTEALETQISASKELLGSLRSQIEAAGKWWGIFASETQLRAADKATLELPELMEATANTKAELDEAYDSLHQLKRFLFL